MNFSVFTSYLEKLSTTSSRIEITKILSELLTALSVGEIKEASYLLTGSLGPSYDQHLFNIADKMLLRALSEAFSSPLEEVTALYKKMGDLGEVSYTLAQSNNSTHVQTIQATFKNLHLLTEESGDGSQDKRIQLLSHDLKNMGSLGAKYYVRIISGSLRLGFSERTLIDAISWMESGGKKYSSLLLKSYEVVPDIGALCEKVKKEGIEKAIKDISPVVGIPVQPMLAQRLKSPGDMIKKMGEVSIEPKFDGLRVLIHYSKEKGILKAFTRNLKNISQMFPELSHLSSHIHADELILDSEVVGMDPSLMKILDFQTTMQRRRKHEVLETQNKIPVTFQVFDLLYKNGTSFMNEPYLKRREELRKTIINGSLLKVDDNTITSDPRVITKLHEEYLQQGLEGIIAKKTESTYVPGRLGWRWVKMKETERSRGGKLSDTIDAVIMGFSQGQGKRASFGIGQFLVGVKDQEVIKTICKVGTGLTDEEFKELNQILSSIKVEKMPAEYEVHKNLAPDFWVKPQIVVELAADDITVSPNHTAGFALRFPRLIKIRTDKSVNEATTLSELNEMFDLQKR